MAEPTPLYCSCPFCGEQAHFEGDMPAIMCDGCGATGPTVSNESCDEFAEDSEVERVAWMLWSRRGPQ